jgi:hypothetical protein
MQSGRSGALCGPIGDVSTWKGRKAWADIGGNEGEKQNMKVNRNKVNKCNKIKYVYRVK